MARFALVLAIIGLVCAGSVVGEPMDAAPVSATVYGSPSSPLVKYGVLDCNAPNALACGTFDNSYNATGWGRLHIAASDASGVSHLDAAWGVGYIEGVLTQHMIFEAYTNYMVEFWGADGTPVAAAVAWVKTHYTWVRQYAKDHSNEPYWGAVQTFLSQYDGLAAGYSKVAPAAEAFTAVDFMFLQLDGDSETIQDLVQFRNHAMRSPREPDTRCSVLVRATDSNLFMSHDTWDSFVAMLRIFKHYTLRVVNPDSGEVETSTVSFSSTPGYLSSVDDYYLSSNGIYVSETTNGFYNTSLYAEVPDTGTTLSWMRCMIATFTAKNGQEWTHTFGRFNSGTYNNQWMVVTLDAFVPGTGPSSPSQLRDGLFWVLEQLPGLIVAQDMTGTLRSAGYWGSYNVPYFPKVYTMSGFEKMYKQHGNSYSHEHCPRANIFRRDAPTVETMDDYQKLMQHNKWQTDPLQLGSAANGIMARYDLVKSDPDAYGGIDSKVTDHAMAMKGQTYAMNGPTKLTQPVFEWTPKWHGDVHLGEADRFDYEYQLMQPQPPCVW